MSSKIDLYNHIKEKTTLISEIEHFGFWNDSLNFDEQPKPAVYFELLEMTIINQFAKVSQTERYAETRQRVVFRLHLICTKNNTDDKDLNYLEQILIAEKLYHEIQDTEFETCVHLKRISERYDANSDVTMDWQIDFDAILNNYGYTDNIKKITEIETNFTIQ